MLKIIDRITDNITDRIISKKHVRNINYKTDNVRENIADLENLTNVLEQKEIELDQHIKLMEYENNILLTLSKSNNLYEVLEKIVNSIELICDHCYGSILTKDGETLRDMCSPNVPKEYANKLKDGFPIGKGYGTCGEVAHTKKELYIKDIAKHPNWSNFPDIQKKALKSGIKSCYSVPILNDKNEVLGTIAIYITCDNINFNLYDSILKWSAKVASIAIQKHSTLDKLHNTNNHLSSILKTQRDIIGRITKDGIITYANESGADFTGMSTEDLIGIDFFRYVYPPDLDIARKQLKSVFEKDERSLAEYRCVDKDNEIRWMEWESYLVGDELQGVGRDITERREAESKANAILKAIPDLMFIFDKQGKYLECHTKDEDLLIYPSDEIVDKNIEDVFDDEELINFSKEMIKKTLYYQKLHTVEYNLSIGGVVKSFEARLVPLENKVMSIVRDITEKKAAEKKLKRYFEEINNKNQLLKTIINCSGGYLWYKGPKGRYIFCDRQFQIDFFKMLSVLDAQGYTDIELIDMYREEGHRHDFGELCISTDVHSKEMGHQCKYIEGGFIDNQLFILEVIKNPYYNNGEYEGNIGFAINRSNDFERIKEEIDYYTTINKCEQLSEQNYNGSPFVYYIKNGEHKYECIGDNK